MIKRIGIINRHFELGINLKKKKKDHNRLRTRNCVKKKIFTVIRCELAVTSNALVISTS